MTTSITAAEVAADWCVTGHGRLFHVKRRGKRWNKRAQRERTVTLCGRLVFEDSDAPWGITGKRACQRCVAIMRSMP